jgi:hypothetical protein
MSPTMTIEVPVPFSWARGAKRPRLVRVETQQGLTDGPCGRLRDARSDDPPGHWRDEKASNPRACTRR